MLAPPSPTGTLAVRRARRLPSHGGASGHRPARLPVCSDLDAWRIREELDALAVMGISVVERLVLPRALATVTVAALLNGVVMFFAIITTLLVIVVTQDLSSGSYLSSVATLARLSDLWLSLFKAAAVSGVICTVVAAHKGMTVAKGPAAWVTRSRTPS